jgi:acyl-CoA dehydrogenase
MGGHADLRASVRALLERHAPEADAAWSAGLWGRLRAAGFAGIGLAESLGGSGGGLGEAATVVREAGRRAAPVPIADVLLVAVPLLTAAAMPMGEAPVAVALPTADEVRLERSGRGWRLAGTVRRVPWAGASERVLVPVAADDGLLLAGVPTDLVAVSPGQNLAGEPRDDVCFDDVVLPDDDVRRVGLAWEQVELRAALSRVVLTAGALERTLELTCDYAGQREQFGRAIGRFQAVRQLVARLGAEVSAGVAVAEAAVAGADAARAPFVITAAKVRSARAATAAAALAHQVHGAIGVTREHPLHASTRRLWSWRDEYGAQGDGERRLGRMVLAAGADALWPTIAGA